MKANKLFTIIAFLLCSMMAYTQHGTLDHSFNPGTDSSATIESISIQNDGKIIIGGRFSFAFNNGVISYRIARLNIDGSIDNSFTLGQGGTTRVYTTSIQSDGKIIIGGSFANYNGTGMNCLARLNTNGSHENSFDKGTGPNDWVYTTSIQNDGKIIIGGQFFSYNGTGRNRIARLNTDGSLDLSFSTGSGFSNSFFTPIVYTASIQSDGKIIVGGDFLFYQGTSSRRIARLNTNGSHDTSFKVGTGFYNSIGTARVYSTSIQSDGKIIVGGVFDSYNGTNIKNITRLNMDGSLDLLFKPGTGANSIVRSISIQSDGKIIIGGNFTSYNGIPRNRIARLNVDGSLDLSFDPGMGVNYTVRTISIQSDGKSIIGGDFTSCNGITRNHIARLTAFGTSVPNHDKNESLFNIFPNPFSTHTTLQSDHFINDGTITIYNTLGEVVSQINNINGQSVSINRGNLANGLYFIRLTEGKHEIMMKKVIVVD